jgi:hypothetical protein
MPYSSSLSTQAHYCLSTQAVTPSSANTRPGGLSGFATVPSWPRRQPSSLRLIWLQLAPQLPGIGSNHRIQVTGARLPPGLEHRTPPARADAERELRARSPQPDQLRPHPRRSRPSPVQQRPGVQREAPVVPVRLHGTVSVLAASRWHVVFPGGHRVSPASGSARSPGIPDKSAARTRPDRGSASRPSTPAANGGTSTRDRGRPGRYLAGHHHCACRHDPRQLVTNPLHTGFSQ